MYMYNKRVQIDFPSVYVQKNQSQVRSLNSFHSEYGRACNIHRIQNNLETKKSKRAGPL